MDENKARGEERLFRADYGLAGTFDAGVVR
jgi:hypothetical protein